MITDGKKSKFIIGDADPFHFESAPDPYPRIRFVESRIRPKIKKNIAFFLLITKKMIYYYINIENFNSTKKLS